MRGFKSFLIFLAAVISFVLIIGCSQKKDSGNSNVSNNVVADNEEVLAVVQAAKDRTQRRTALQTEWTGPNTGPKAATGKKIVCVNANSQNGVEALWGESVAEAAKRIGWEITVLDGKGTVQGQVAAINQAISMKVNGIVTSANAEPLQAVIKEAVNAGIPVVGIHASNVPGPNPDLNLFYNCTSSGIEIGKALADYIIADSNGQGRAIILYDAQYAIAREKAEAMRNQLATCPTATLLDYVNTPLSDVPKNMPQLTSSWISKFGTPFYVMSIADYYYDFSTPTLRSGGIEMSDVKLLGSDGTTAAYDRIRNNDYQIVTIPEPPTLFGYMAVDALNRYFAKESPVDYIPDVYIVTNSNVNAEGGDQGIFIPSNNFADEYAKIWGVQ
jgi:ribose transport system substrate-binding protein